jgi:hypothetical protein
MGLLSFQPVGGKGMSAVELVFDSVLAAPERLRDFRQGQFGKIIEFQHLTLCLRKFRQGVLNRVISVHVREGVPSWAVFCTGFLGQCLGREALVRPLLIHCFMARDPKQPSLEPRPSGKFRQTSPGRDPGLLKHVFGGVRVHLTPQKAAQQWLMAADKRVEGSAVAPTGRRDKAVIRIPRSARVEAKLLEDAQSRPIFRIQRCFANAFIVMSVLEDEKLGGGNLFSHPAKKPPPERLSDGGLGILERISNGC